MTVTHVHDRLTKKEKTEGRLKENEFVKNLNCKSHEMLIGPLEQDHIMFIPGDFREEKRVCKQTVSGRPRT